MSGKGVLINVSFEMEKKTNVNYPRLAVNSREDGSKSTFQLTLDETGGILVAWNFASSLYRVHKTIF